MVRTTRVLHADQRAARAGRVSAFLLVSPSSPLAIRCVTLRRKGEVAPPLAIIAACAPHQGRARRLLPLGAEKEVRMQKDRPSPPTGIGTAAALGVGRGPARGRTVAKAAAPPSPKRARPRCTRRPLERPAATPSFCASPLERTPPLTSEPLQVTPKPKVSRALAATASTTRPPKKGAIVASTPVPASPARSAPRTWPSPGA